MTYSYEQLEDAFVVLHEFDGKRGALRGRLNYLAKLGLKPSSPGKGSRIRYTFMDALRWLIALEVESMGMGPSTACRVARELPSVDDANSISADCLLRIQRRALTGIFILDIVQSYELGPFGAAGFISFGRIVANLQRVLSEDHYEYVKAA